MATLTLRTQTTGIRPEFDHATVNGRRALMSPAEALSPRARQVNERVLRRYRPKWSEANEGQRFLLRQAWKDARGNVLPMNYTPVGLTDGSAHEVRFVDNTLVIRRTGPKRFEMEVELEEVR